MAFVFEASRSKKLISSTGEVGPGYYDVTGSISDKVAKSYAPFSSTTFRS